MSIVIGRLLWGYVNHVSYIFELDTPTTSKKDLPKAMLSPCHYKRENF